MEAAFKQFASTHGWWAALVVVLAITALRWVVPRLLTGVFLFFTSRLGWAELAGAYPETAWTEWPQDAAVILGCTGHIGNRWSGYGYRMGVIVARAGIHVSVDQPAYRPFHPPFVLPWAEVQSVAAEGAGRSRRTVIRFVGATGLRARLDLPADALAEVQAASGRSFA